MAKPKKYKGHQNEPLFRSIVERAQSSAGEPHKDRRDKRARTRSAAKRKSLGDQGLSPFPA